MSKQPVQMEINLTLDDTRSRTTIPPQQQQQPGAFHKSVKLGCTHVDGSDEGIESDSDNDLSSARSCDNDEESNDKFYECYDVEDYDEYYTKELTALDKICDVCEKVFKSVGAFRFHQMRHQQLDHFKCPTCRRGFTTQKLCCFHEVNNHRSEMKLCDFKYASQIVKSNSRNPKDVNDEDYEHYDSKPIPSSALEKYRGPPVKSAAEAFEIELKYGRDGIMSKEIEKKRKSFE